MTSPGHSEADRLQVPVVADGGGASRLGSTAMAPVVVPRQKIEDVVENTMFGALAYVGRAWTTTVDAFFHPVAFARAIPSPLYCRPTTYLVVAMFLETWLGTTLLSLERATPDALYDKKATAALSQNLGHSALAGDWSALLMLLAPMIGVIVLFAGFLSLFARGRIGADFHRCFEITCYSVAAPTLVRFVLMLSLLPGMAVYEGVAGHGGFEMAKNATLVAVAVLQVYPVVLLFVHLRRMTGRSGAALWLWLRAALCTGLVVVAAGAWSYPLWKDVVHLPV